MKGHQEESKQTGLAKFPPVYYTYLVPFVLSYFSTTAHSSSNLELKHLGLTISSGLHFLMKAPMSVIKLTVSKCVCFSLLICLCQFNFHIQPGTLRGSRKTFSSPTQLYHIPKSSLSSFWFKDISSHIYSLFFASSVLPLLDHYNQHTSTLWFLPS